MQPSLQNYRRWVFPVHLWIGSRATFLNGCNMSGIGAETSSLQGISHGVPQGSILGSTLFTIYLNNIPTILDVCSLESYVDDLKFYLSFPVTEASNMIQQINKDLKKNRKLALLQRPSHKPREDQPSGVGHTSDASEAAR